MTDSPPNNMLDVNATRIASEQAPVQNQQPSTDTETTSSLPPRDYESLALISQEMNKEHRYLADKRASLQSTNSFYQLAGGAIGGVGSLAYFLNRGQTVQKNVEKGASAIADIVDEHARPYRLFLTARESIPRPKDNEKFTQLIEKHADTMLEHFRTKTLAEDSEKVASSFMRQLTLDLVNGKSYENIIRDSETDVKKHVDLKPMWKKINKVIQFHMLDDTRSPEEISTHLNEAYSGKMLEQVKDVSSDGKVIEEAKAYFFQRISNSDSTENNKGPIRKALRKALTAATLDQRAPQLMIGTGAIIAAATLGNIAFSFLQTSGRRQVKATERKLDALGDAFDLYNAPNNNIKASADMQHEKLDEHAQAKNSSPSV